MSIQRIIREAIPAAEHLLRDQISKRKELHYERMHSAEFSDQAYRLIIQEVPELECCYSGQEAWQTAMKQKVRIKIRAIGEEGVRDYYIFGKGSDLDGRFHCIVCIFREEDI